MAHIEFSGKRQITLGIVCVMKLLFCQVLKVRMHSAEYLGNGSGTQGTLAKHILLSRISLKLYTRQSGTFLTAVMLLLHQKIKFVQPVHPSTVFLLIVLKRLKQSYHSYTAFMF